jgi:hypothetical protein
MWGIVARQIQKVVICLLDGHPPIRFLVDMLRLIEGFEDGAVKGVQRRSVQALRDCPGKEHYSMTQVLEEKINAHSKYLGLNLASDPVD